MAYEYECPKCHESNPAASGFCRRCGGSLSEAKVRRSRWKGLALLALLAVIGVGWWYFSSSPTGQAIAPQRTIPSSGAVVTPDLGPVRKSGQVKIGLAYGTEKEEWLKWAVAEFSKTPAGKNIEVDLKGLGSLEAAQAIVRGDQSIHVWSPASSLYKEVFMRDWKDRHQGTNPILTESPLALTPMVFVMWEERYSEFKKKYKQVDFRNIGEAMSEPGGWATIASRPDWMFFKFSHTNPSHSNSGLMTLVLMGYDFHRKHANLDGRDITNPKFTEWVQQIERGLVGAASGLVNSTGILMTSMIQRGWSTYDAIFVYESVAVERFQQAKGRWGSLRVVYPEYNMWNENPYYVLDVPWSTATHRAAAKSLLDFLLSERIQQQAMVHGFRPANLNVSLKTPDSPFAKYGDTGLKLDVPGTFCEPPRAEVVENLLLMQQRNQNQR